MRKQNIVCCLVIAAIAWLILFAQSPAQATRTGCTLEDFYWYIEDVKQNGIPQNAQIITDKAKICGGWKCFIEHDPLDKCQEAAAKYALINIVIKGDDVKLCLDPLRIKFAREADFRDLTKYGDEIFTGKWKNGTIYVVGPGNIHLTKFYSLNGHQFALGSGVLPDGRQENYALVRP